jgi:hypothetical protein
MSNESQKETKPMDYEIAVMSYERPDKLVELTLATLDRHKTQHSRITVFVADEQQAEIYKRAIPATIKIKVTELGHFNSIRSAQQFYEAGTRLIIMDDDIRAIEQKNDNILEQFNGTLDDLAELGFNICETNDCRMWGVYPARNAFYMSDEAVIGLRYIIGCLWGTYAQDIAIMTDQRLFDSSGNDFETTLQSFRHHGKVARLEYITANTKYFAEGGIDAELKHRGIDNRQTDHTKLLRRIASRHPQLASTYTKANGVTNLRLKTITARRIPR